MKRQELQHRKVRRGLAIFLAVIVSVVVGMMANESSYAQEAGGARVTLEAPAQVGVGEVIRLRLRLEGDVAVGGFEALLLYPRLVGEQTIGEYAGFAPAAPGEQGIGQLVVPEVAAGSVVGYYTCGTAPCLARREVQVQAAAEPGVLGEVELLARAAGQFEVRVEQMQVVDRTGQPLAVSLAQSSVVVQVGEGGEAHSAPADAWNWTRSGDEALVASATAADVTQDGGVTHSDVMEVALAWQIVREAGEPCGGREASADINGDGCVDIVDVQTAAAYASGENEPVVEEPKQWAVQLYLPLVNNPTAAVAQALAVLTFAVNSTLDEYDARLSDNKCLSPSGVCTLRAAIQQANARQGSDVIVFAIPGSGVHTIQLGNRLPSLWDATGGTVIDGYSQPGASPNTDPLVSNAQIRVQIRGNGPEAFDGLAITSADNVVKGLAFYNLKRSLWVYGDGAHDNVIVGNFIGIDATGGSEATVTSQMQAHGVHLEQKAMSNRIGGVLLAERNVISGNARHGVGFWHVGTVENLVFNNLIGLSPDGTRRLSNRIHGVDINYGASNNTVGGVQPGERNVISGNNGSGAEMSHGAVTTQNLIRGNYIGTDVSGDAGPAYAENGQFGVSVKDRVVNNRVLDNVIGNNLGGGIQIDNFGNCCTSNNVVRNNRIGIGISGNAIGNALFGIKVLAPQSQIGPGNIIAYNPVGIQIEGDANDGNRITQNSIFGNVGLGIDLAPVAQTNLNDQDDLDTGPNEQLNFPVLEKTWPSPVTGKACANCTVEIYIADGGANAYGEGRTLVGTGVAAGDGTFSVPVSGVTEREYLTATATDAAGNTSEFSLNRVVGAPNPWEQVFSIPGRIEAEDYRNGGAGTGYSDTTSGNSGRAYRKDDVDIEVTQDSSGNYDVAWIAPGEWLSYDINVAAAGNYQLLVRVATPSGGRRFHIEIDGNNVSGSVAIPWTGGWQNWVNVSVVIPLPAGSHTLRFVAETDRFNLNYYEITAQ